MLRALCFFALLPLLPAAPTAETEWRTYGHDSGGNRHSPLKQIDRGNVNKLKVAWTFRTHELDNRPDDPNHRQKSNCVRKYTAGDRWCALFLHTRRATHRT